MMEIVQWNCTSLRAQINYTKLIINTYNPSITALQETRFKQNHCININQFKVYFKNRDESAGGVAIYVKENYHTEEIPLQTTLEAVAVKIFCDRIVTICNLYIPPDRVINHSEIENITSQLNHPFIILGDFNAKSNAWGIDNEVQNQQGKEIENLLLNNSQLCLLNNGAPTHFSTRFGSFSAIDLTICTSDIVHVLD